MTVVQRFSDHLPVPRTIGIVGGLGPYTGYHSVRLFQPYFIIFLKRALKSSIDASFGLPGAHASAAAL